MFFFRLVASLTSPAWVLTPPAPLIFPDIPCAQFSLCTDILFQEIAELLGCQLRSLFLANVCIRKGKSIQRKAKLVQWLVKYSKTDYT